MQDQPEDPEPRSSTLILECWVEEPVTHCLNRQFHFDSDESYKQFVVNILFIPHPTNLRLSITENTATQDVKVSICRKTINMEEGILELMASVEEASLKAHHTHEFKARHPFWSWLQSLGKPRRRGF